MALRCNICSIEIDEKEVENHVATAAHVENMERIGKAKESGSGASVAKAWKDSL